MIKTYKYPSKSALSRVAAISKRDLAFSKKDYANVVRILADVRKHGDTALMVYVNRFDAPDMKLSDLRVGEAEMAEAAKKVDAGFLNALDRAAAQIAQFFKRVRCASPGFRRIGRGRSWANSSIRWMPPVYTYRAEKVAKRRWFLPSSWGQFPLKSRA